MLLLSVLLSLLTSTTLIKMIPVLFYHLPVLLHTESTEFASSTFISTVPRLVANRGPVVYSSQLSKNKLFVGIKGNMREYKEHCLHVRKPQNVHSTVI